MRFAMLLLLQSLSTLVTAQSRPPTTPPNRFALLIAQSQYEDLTALHSPSADVSLLTGTLEELGFKVTAARNLDEKGFKDAPVQQFIRALPKGAVVLVYYAGYAVVDTNQESYLLPVTAVSAARDEYNRVVGSWSVTRLLSDLAERDPSVLIAWLDAPWASAKLDPNAGLRPLPERIPQNGAISVLYSQDPRSERVSPEPLWNESPFARAIDAALRKPGLTLGQVRDDIKAATRELSGERLKPFDDQSSGLSEVILRPALPAKPVGPKPMEKKIIERMMYVFLPPGPSWMGCVAEDTQCKPDEAPGRKVELSQGFWIAATETTIQAFRAFERPQSKRLAGTTDTNDSGKLGKNPITKVTWYAAQAYCQSAGGRLPTEAEWEYAARGGKMSSIYPWDSGPEDLHNHANLAKSRKRTTDVYGTETAPTETFEANRFGLFDMAGNVQEWVADWYALEHDQSQVRDPQGAPTGVDKVVKGGSFNSDAASLRVSSRNRQKPDSMDNQTGFRCVLPTAIQ